MLEGQTYPSLATRVGFRGRTALGYTWTRYTWTGYTWTENRSYTACIGTCRQEQVDPLLPLLGQGEQESRSSQQKQQPSCEHAEEQC